MVTTGTADILIYDGKIGKQRGPVMGVTIMSELKIENST